MGIYDPVFKILACDPDGNIQISKGVTALDVMDNNRDRLINVALDQSTSQIGMCITDAETDDLLGIADICNLGFPTVFDFKQYFLALMKCNLFDSRIRHFFYEIPLEHGKNMRARRVLNDLREFISEFPHYIPSLESANMIEINNRTWKTHYLADPIYTGRKSRTEDVKLSAMNETMARFPGLERYCMSFSHPPDSCDAVGIMYGGLEEIRSSFSKDFMRINRTMEQSTGASYSAIGILSSWGTLLDDINANSGVFQEHYGFEVVEFNPKMSLKENCSRWVAGHNRVAYAIVLDSKSQQVVRWEYNLPIIMDPSQQFYVIRIGRKNPAPGLK